MFTLPVALIAPAILIASIETFIPLLATPAVIAPVVELIVPPVSSIETLTPEIVAAVDIFPPDE